MILISGPEELGGRSDLATKGELLAKETGKTIDEIYIELFAPNKGQIRHPIGLPKVYDYECHIKVSPETVLMLAGMYNKVYKQFRDCDGVITTSTCVLEQESNEAFKAYYEGSGRSYYIAGPLAITSIDQLSRERSPDRNAVEEFLDRILQKHGERSPIYIITHDNSKPPLPDSLRAKLEASDFGMGASGVYFATQGKLPSIPSKQSNISRNNQALSWFLTACGQNSVLESLSHGKPMIAWPVQADQSMNSMCIGELKHNVGYELLEVQHRDESQPLYRGYTPRGTLDAIENELRTVLQKAFGSEGAEKRRNPEIFKEKLSHLWDEDGDARWELRRFVKDYLS